MGDVRARPARSALRQLAVAVTLVGTLAGCESRAPAAAGVVTAAGAGVPASPTSKQMDKYDWLASNSGPNGCPMEIVGGDFFFPGGGSLYIPKANLHSGWGRDVSVHVVGDDTKPLPDRVEVEFFSFLENKFYRGSFALPRDSIARLFKEGFQRITPPGGRDTYQALVAGVAPGGAVAIWASGSDRQVEVFFGQAEPADVDFHRAFDAPDNLDRGAFVAGELAEAGKQDPLVRPMMQHVPIGRWAAYRPRYRWRPAFERIPAPDRIAPIRFFNGERDYLLLPLDAAAERADRAVPEFVSFADRTSRRSYEVTFDADETLAAFARAGAGARAVELVFAAGGEAGVRVSVRSAAETIELHKVKVETFGAR